jgi:hypothetical protein
MAANKEIAAKRHKRHKEFEKESGTYVSTQLVFIEKDLELN